MKRTTARFFLLGAFLVSSSAAATQPTASTAKHEIARLLDALENSGCEFNRNGSWYGAARAREHLGNKYEYLAKRRQVTSTERFIELAAATSSMTGRPYLVRCGHAGPIESRVWLLRELERLRAAGKTG